MLGWVGLVIISFGIFGVWFLLFSFWGFKEEGNVDRLIASAVGATAQIILVEILLGHLGFLTLGGVLLIHFFFSGILLGGLFFRGLIPLRNFAVPFKQVGKDIPTWWERTKGWENGILMGLTLLLILWLGVAAYLFPPRGMDDVYHLPPVYQYYQDHRISILPLDLRPQFAYPQNAELLFLWFLIFVGDVRVVDMVQLFLIFLGCLAIYSLATRLGSPPRVALFVSLLFSFSPVVVGQAGSAYVDLIISVYFLSALALAVGFWQTGRFASFYMVGLVAGLLVGMKYSMVFLVLGIQPLVLYPLWKGLGFEGTRPALIYILLFIIGGSYWYLRNLMVLGSFLGPSVS
ncbi:MAG TPA: glycosyltransferase family 39 protein [Nitrospiria bacterium]|jgi:hypothetical protein